MADNWNIDASHSSVDFKVRHMGISSVKGSFDSFTGTVEMEGEELKGVKVTIDPSSISTKDAQRDGHLKSADFFDVENHPEIIFESSDVQKLSDDTYKVKGTLTMRGETKPVEFKAELGESIKDPWGMTRAAASVSGKLNRKDWGLNWNQVLEAGSLLVSEEVQFNFDVQAVKA
ncbi:MAG: YceI family protein [Trueperaceae bacterium]|nr:YceI family protein [Trueperaceae bacterium]